MVGLGNASLCIRSAFQFPMPKSQIQLCARVLRLLCITLLTCLEYMLCPIYVLEEDHLLNGETVSRKAGTLWWPPPCLLSIHAFSWVRCAGDLLLACTRLPSSFSLFLPLGVGVLSALSVRACLTQRY